MARQDWRPITDLELTVVVALLAAVQWPTGSLDARYLRFCQDSPRITERGAAYLAYLRHRFRRQLDPGLPWLEGADKAITRVGMGEAIDPWRGWNRSYPIKAASVP